MTDYVTKTNQPVYCALFAAVLHYLGAPKVTIAWRLGLFLLGVSLGLLIGGVLNLMSRYLAGPWLT
jgi:hypothetical protein